MEHGVRMTALVQIALKNALAATAARFATVQIVPRNAKDGIAGVDVLASGVAVAAPAPTAQQVARELAAQQVAMVKAAPSDALALVVEQDVPESTALVQLLLPPPVTVLCITGSLMQTIRRAQARIPGTHAHQYANRDTARLVQQTDSH
jgi:hypothetical protein